MRVFIHGCFSEVACSRCGGKRLARQDGTPGACSFIPCPSPLYDAEIERGRAKCAECGGRGYHVGELHPRETCGVCAGLGLAPGDNLRFGLVTS